MSIAKIGRRLRVRVDFIIQDNAEGASLDAHAVRDSQAEEVVRDFVVSTCDDFDTDDFKLLTFNVGEAEEVKP